MARPKLRHDVNETAFRLVQAATGDGEAPKPSGVGKPNAEAVKRGRKGGQKGGRCALVFSPRTFRYPSPMTAPATRLRVVRRGQWLTWATLGYNSLEGLLSVVAGLLAGSVALGSRR